MFHEFMELRRQGMLLGIRDYLVLLKALEKGYGTSSREALLYTCSTLWARSRNEQFRIERLLDALLPDKPDQTAEVEVLAEDHETTTSRDSGLPSETDAPASTPTEASDRSSSEESPSTGSGVDSAPLFSDETVEVRVNPGALGESPSWQSNEAFELEPREPIPARLMRRVWRGYRRAGRSGPKVELDVEAAIEQLSRYGTLFQLPMQALRMNQSRLLLLVDEGDSMRPFRYTTRSLIDAASAAGLARFDVRYFRDVPRKNVYKDAGMRESQPLEQALEAFVDQGVMIFSDAGAARGQLEDQRIEASVETINLLFEVTPTIVWLNPAPRRRWRHTGAAAILESTTLPMYPFNTIGLRQAVAALHGREA